MWWTVPAVLELFDVIYQSFEVFRTVPRLGGIVTYLLYVMYCLLLCGGLHHSSVVFCPWDT